MKELYRISDMLNEARKDSERSKRLATDQEDICAKLQKEDASSDINIKELQNQVANRNDTMREQSSKIRHLEALNTRLKAGQSDLKIRIALLESQLSELGCELDQAEEKAHRAKKAAITS